MEKDQQTIAIYTYTRKGVDPWDPRSIDAGIAGAEEAVIYVANELASLGYRVTVFGEPPADSPYAVPDANPRYILCEPFNEKDRFDIAISWRMPEFSPQLRQVAKRVYFWPHDICQCAISGKAIDEYDDVLWLSHWQREQWIRFNPRLAQYTHVFGHGIIEEQFQPLKERTNPYSCIYGSNYSKGLEVLLEVWPVVKHQFPQATLDIFYGWAAWTKMSSDWEKEMRSRLLYLSSFGVKEHGKVGHKTLNEAFENSSFWTFPCVVPETFCITALRAQYAGAIPIIIDEGALEETVQYGWACSHPRDYLPTLLKALQHAEKISLHDRLAMRTFVQNNFTWKRIAARWKELFEGA